MPKYAGKDWSKKALLSVIGDPLQIAGAQASVLTDGKAEGVKIFRVRSGEDFSFSVLPGRGMDIYQAHFRGKSLNFLSGTGITAPGYYQEPGLGWLRAFFAGLLTTCGIANAGAPSSDQGEAFGLHGRVSNTGAENLCLDQHWEGDEFLISLQGTVREASAMQENLSLTRRIETRLGRRGFTLHDLIENHGFEPQPLMMLYHFNFGFPLLAPGAEIVGPILDTVASNEQAALDRGVEECLVFPEPEAGYEEKVFFHTLAADPEGRTFISLFNKDSGGSPLGIVMRFNRNELPCLTQWKMPRKGFYVQGLEPGTITPEGRGVLREKGKLPLLDGQQSYSITIEFEVVDSLQEMEGIRQEAKNLVSR